MSRAADPGTSYLLRAFREFYAELARQRRAVLADPWPRAAEGEAPVADPAGAQGVSGRLLALLQRQALEAGRHGGQAGATMYRDAQYVMAALGDEVFLHLDWRGRQVWAGALLEARLSGTHVAGERVFDRIDQLLRDRDPVQRDLAAVYLMALSLGFQGRYRESRDAARLEEYRRELFGFVFRRQPSLVRGERRLFPPAYEHTLRSAPPPPARRATRWAAVLAGVALAYLLAAGLAWRDASGPVRAAALGLVQSVEDGPRPATAPAAPRDTPAVEDARIPDTAPGLEDPEIPADADPPVDAGPPVDAYAPEEAP